MSNTYFLPLAIDPENPTEERLNSAIGDWAAKNAGERLTDQDGTPAAYVVSYSGDLQELRDELLSGIEQAQGDTEYILAVREVQRGGKFGLPSDQEQVIRQMHMNRIFDSKRGMGQPALRTPDISDEEWSTPVS